MRAKVLKATFIRNFIIMLRAYPKSFFIGNVCTGFYTVVGALFMYKLLFNGVVGDDFFKYTKTEDYMGYVIWGSLTYIFVVRTCLNVSRSLITELREGTLESLMMTPFKRGEYFIGNMLHQTIATTFEVLISLIIAMPFGLSFKSMNFPAFIFVFFLALYGFFGLSMVLGSVMLYTRDTYISQNTLFVAMFLLCGITFPVEYLPHSLKIIGELIPVTEISNLIRGSAILGKGLSEQIGTIVYVFILSTIYLFIGFLSLKKIEYIALEKIQG
ncbi:ABC-2 type transport system permease protein [Hathewaya proteolytica DSM 3090]|uniref:Transport permease protein n=1 Tax=Hathewaya proteolytica DSM 3090 TaxID=1121331 RepID=A0A1M6RAD2_9CLOT|nr:ABC transporter permease [Hathewaya proteolytica]SHK29376.1 ABC-2 type transport system permease protein [Hathewaya proteolytica DSM 3090]